MQYDIGFQENPTDENLAVLEAGIGRHTESAIGTNSRTTLTFLVRDVNGQIVGGVHGNCDTFGWLYVSMLWVSEQLQGNGFGSRLMECIESRAVEEGCRNSYLDTFSFQAPEFYKGLGYSVFAELEGFPSGHSRFFLRKRIAELEGE